MAMWGATDGYLKFDPVGGKTWIPAPASIHSAGRSNKMMASPENREKLRLPPDVSNIAVSNGQAIVSYK